MLQFGACIYYDITNMQVIYVVYERQGAVIATDIYYDMGFSPSLANTNILNVRCIVLNFGDDEAAAIISNGLQYPPAPIIP